MIYPGSEQAPAESGAASELEHCRSLLKDGNPVAAATALQAFLEAQGESAEPLYLLAVCQRLQRQHSDAIATLDRLRRLTPDSARAYQELGHVRRDAGALPGAVAAYQQAVRLNPALPASWRELARLQDAIGQTEAARQARAQYQRLSALPRELLSVTSFLNEGKLYKAERLCRAFLKRNPRHVEAMRLLAALGVELHVYDDAEFLLESALAFEPEYLPARLDYVRVLQKRQKFARALEESRRALDTAPDNPALRTLHASTCMAAGRYQEALGIYAVESERPGASATVDLARGHALKTVGRQAEAVAAYRRATARRPDFGDPYWSLANLKTYRFSDEELSAMESLEQNPDTGLEDRYHLCFALGKALEDRGAFDESFEYYARGNALKRRTGRYSADRMAEEFDRQIRTCTAELLSTPGGNPAPDPIFIVGLPRAGSTLLEQILASHSQVEGTLELPNVLALVRQLDGRRRVGDPHRYPAILADLNEEQRLRFGAAYLQETAIHRSGAPCFTDKMPNNFRHIGLIHLILPNAKIIDARRDPMACCVSGFKQLFAEGQEFTYDLEDIGRYYRDYVRLMKHWHEVLPGRILHVQHEDVVADLEGQVRRMLDFCGLEFEPRCLAFHTTPRAVRTASSEQVRRPLNRDGLDEWRRYDAHLEPLRRALGPELAH